MMRSTAQESKVAHPSAVASTAPNTPSEAQPVPRDPQKVLPDGQYDSKDPKCWPEWKKTLNVAISSALIFQMQMGSSIVAPALGQIQGYFDIKSDALASFIISIYVLGFAFGPLAWGPGSEVWGRIVVYHTCNVLTVIMTVGCALSTSLGMLLAFRFLNGCFGSVATALGGGVIADVARPTQRGKFGSIMTVGPVVGPIIGPVIGGFLSEAAGWRWCFWLMTIVEAAITLLAMALLSESYPPVLLQKRMKRLRKENGNSQSHAIDAITENKETKFGRAISRPLRMLARCPVALITALNLALTFSYIYILFTTFPAIIQGQYHFSEGLSGLAYIAVGIGDVLGIIICALLNDRLVILKAKKTGQVHCPEARLILLLFILPLLPVGLLWYGWAAQEKTHWVAVELGAIPVGVGIVGSSICAQTYMVDTYTSHAASAMAATTFLRSLAGAFLPLAGKPLYNRLGFGWGNVVLAGIALLSCGSFFMLWRYGGHLREKYPFEKERHDRREEPPRTVHVQPEGHNQDQAA